MRSMAAPTFLGAATTARSGTAPSPSPSLPPTPLLPPDPLAGPGHRRAPLDEAVLDHPVVVVDLGEVRAAAVGERHQDGRARAEALRGLQPRPRGRPAPAPA